MRRRGLVAVVVVVAAAVGVASVDAARRHAEGRPGMLGSSVAGDPRVVARRARELARAEPLLVTLVSGGHEVARARIERDRAEVAAAGLTGLQEGRWLQVLGTTVEVAAPDPDVLLGPLVNRPVRWEGRHLRLVGGPPAQAWIDGAGHLSRLEVDLGGGGLLVVTPAV